jgi:prepilin-type N-terminal cleavage/methylation domain-containing protein
MPTERSPRRGFTLTEMLVALAIMAVLTTVAVQSLGPVADQARYAATERTLTNVRDAILASGPSAVSGYFVDMGQLPSTVNDLLAGTTSWTVDANGIPHGWRGPYVTPPLMTTASSTSGSIVDGWGNPLSLTSDGSGGLLIQSAGPPPAGPAISLSLPSASLYAGSLVVTFASASQSASTVSGTATLYYPGGNVPATINGTSISFSASNPAQLPALGVGPKALLVTVGMQTTTVNFVMRLGVNTLNVPVTSSSTSTSSSQNTTKSSSSQ